MTSRKLHSIGSKTLFAALLFFTATLFAQTRPFITIDAPGATSETIAASINNAGVIAGYYADGAGMTHGFVRDVGGVFTEFTPVGILKKDAPLRALFLGQGPDDKTPQPTFNMLVRHGVKSCLEYAKSGDVQKSRLLSNPDLSPHLSFIDMGGHGYSIVHAAADRLETDFICLPRPIIRQEQPDGGPILYRVRHAAKLWGKGERPKLEQKVIEGNPAFSI